MILLDSRIHYWRERIRTIFCVEILVQKDMLEAPEHLYSSYALIPEAGDNVYAAFTILTDAALEYLNG